jgi:glycosyltransferase involved in cell wall biosynthesis
VYDCMDELSNFKNASPNLPAYEQQLLAQADVVFTGGKSLFEAKKNLHEDVYCFPSSVDRDHFQKALHEETEIPEDLTGLRKPVVGYYGVIDERIDFSLLKYVAEKLSNITIVMIGPFAKIDEKDAAQAANLHYLGKKDYAQLPHYLKGMDVAIMPFALNEATRYISPTKTLEFMAAEKPIVSTPIHDVVRDYAEVVEVASTPHEFAGLIQQCLNETAEERAFRVTAQREIVERTSWHNTVTQMEKIIQGKTLRLSAPVG